MDAAIGAVVRPAAGPAESGVIATRIGNFYYQAPNGIAFIKDDAAAFVMNPGGSHNAGTVAPDDSFHRVVFLPAKATPNVHRVEFQWSRMGDAIVGRLQSDEQGEMSFTLSENWPGFSTRFFAGTDGVEGIATLAGGKTVTWRLKSHPTPKSADENQFTVMLGGPGKPTYLVAGFGELPSLDGIDSMLAEAQHAYEKRRTKARGPSGDILAAITDKATLGSAYAYEPAYPKTESDADRAAAESFHLLNNVFFLHAARHGDYPTLAFHSGVPYETMGFRPGDEKTLQVPLDWIGVHYYERLAVSASGAALQPAAGQRNADPFASLRTEHFNEGLRTDSGIKVWPRGFYDLLMRISRDYDHPIIEITETGGVYFDAPGADGLIHDQRRIDFYRQHLAEMARAMSDGARVRAYHAWSLLDNFEWKDGFALRMGLTYVDFATQKRTVKDSGYWYGRVAAAGRLDV